MGVDPYVPQDGVALPPPVSRSPDSAPPRLLVQRRMAPAAPDSFGGHLLLPLATHKPPFRRPTSPAISGDHTLPNSRLLSSSSQRALAAHDARASVLSPQDLAPIQRQLTYQRLGDQRTTG